MPTVKLARGLKIRSSVMYGYKFTMGEQRFIPWK